MFGRNVLLNMLLRALFIHVLDLRFTIYDLTLLRGVALFMGSFAVSSCFPRLRRGLLRVTHFMGFRLCGFGIVHRFVSGDREGRPYIAAVRFVSGGYATRPYMGVCAVVVSGDHLCFVTVAPTCQSLGYTLFIYVGILNGHTVGFWIFYSILFGQVH